MASLDRASRRPVLVTGASGRIGRMLTSAWQHRYALSLVDAQAPCRQSGASCSVGDVSSLAFVRPLCAGIDTVVHLAGLPSPRTEWPALRRHNIRTLWAMLRAAREAGCRRLVFASSVLIDADPDRPYSKAKRLGEKLGQRYADRTDLSVICLRLGRVLAPGDRALWPGAWYLPRVAIEQDVVHAFTLAVEAPASMRYETLTIISANRTREFDISEARARLGYAPQMDAFALADRRYHSLFGLLKRAKIRMTRRS